MKKEKALPKVSINIPCFNQKGTIAQAIRSAMRQDYPNLEIVISDNHSTDGSVDIIKMFDDPRLKVFLNKKNKGRIQNYRDFLYKRTTGELFLNIDGDDFLDDPRYISKAVKLYMEIHGCVLVFAKSRTLIESTGLITYDKVNSSLPKKMDGNKLFLKYTKGHAFPYITCLQEVKHSREVNFYRKDIMSLDWESLLKLILNRQVGYINEYPATYRRHDMNSTKALSVQRMIINREFIEEPYKYAKKLGVFSDRKLDRWKHLMLKRYFIKQLVRCIVLEQTSVRHELYAKIDKLYPLVYKSIKQDVRYRLFRKMYKNKALVRFVFKHIILLEGFYHDLENTQVAKEHYKL